jgi:molybdate transport system substrate-binding protein
MLEATAIACPDPALGGSSGVHIAKVFERLGISEALKPKLVYVRTPEQAQTMPGHVVAEGKAEIALHQMQELMAVPGIEIVGPLPAELQNRTVYQASVAAQPHDEAAALRLLRHLGSADAQSVLRAAGID